MTPPDSPDDERAQPADSRDAEPTEDLSREEAEELVEEIERRRSLRGPAVLVVSAIGILFSIFQLFLAAQGFQFGFSIPFVGTLEISLQLLQANAVHVAFALVLVFLLFPPSTGDGFLARRLGRIVPGAAGRLGDAHPVTRGLAGVRSGVRWALVDRDRERITPADAVCIVVAVLAALYFLTDFREIRDMRVFGLESGRPVTEIVGGLVPALDPFLSGIPIVSEYSYAFILGVLGVLLVLEATRRTLGLPLVLIVVSFIVYARWGYLLSTDTPFIGVLAINELDWPAIIQNLWYNTENGVFGIPVTVSVQFIYIFILFGSFLEMSGAGQWFIDLAYAATGRRRGGPAKASILASGFMGTISGSSIANTVTTGAFTIPLMKRSGYSPEFAGAVEASASSGGQILPPVMGAAAFLMVQYTGTPFADIIILATIPAVVFFFGVWVMVHLKAVQEGIGGISGEETVPLRAHMVRGWFYLVPILLLLYYLIIARLSVARSAWFTLVALVALVSVVAGYSRETRGVLAGTFLLVTGAELAAYTVGGVGVVALLTGAGGAGLVPAAAAGIVLGKVGWYAILAGIVAMLYRPGMTAPYLELDTKVQHTAEAAGDALGRPGLGDNQSFRVGTFLVKSLDEGARTAVPVVIAVAAAGIIPGVISVSGLGPNLTALLLALSGGSLVIMLLVTAVSSIVLGMGMPTTVTYIILISMLAQPLVEFGIPLLAAHLFILYFGVIADITPPVAVAAYAASGVAKSDAFETGVKAFSLSLNKAVVPFAFVLVPGIVLLREVTPGQFRVVSFADLAEVTYSVPEILVPVAGVFLGVVALGATVIGTLYTRVTRTERWTFALSSVLLMAPGLISTSVFDALGFLGQSVSLAEGTLLMIDLTMRAMGLAVFLVLALRNRRRAAGETTGVADAGEESAEVA